MPRTSLALTSRSRRSQPVRARRRLPAAVLAAGAAAAVLTVPAALAATTSPTPTTSGAGQSTGYAQAVDLKIPGVISVVADGQNVRVQVPLVGLDIKAPQQ